MMRLVAALLLASPWVASPAQACSPFIADFPDQASRPGQTVVIGCYVADPGREGSDSSLFVVDEVLSGTLPRSRYRLVMEGPWGSLCEISAMEATGSTRPEDNPVVLLVESRVDADTLNLPFARERALLVDSKVVATRGYAGTPGAGFRWLARTETVEMDLDTFKAWLRTEPKDVPGPWKSVSDTLGQPR